MAILRPTVLDEVLRVQLGTILRGSVILSAIRSVQGIEAELDFAGRSIAGRIAVDSERILSELGRKLPVQLDVDVSLIAAALQRIEGLHESRTIAEILEGAAIASFSTPGMAQGISRSFEEVWSRRAAQGRPPWAPLSEFTIALKRQLGLSDIVAEHPLLQWGRLFESMTEPTFQSDPSRGIVRNVASFVKAAGSRVQVALQIEWGTSLEYAQMHMKGGRGSVTGNPVPARPFIPGYFERAEPEFRRSTRMFQESVMDRIRSSVRAREVLARRAILLGRPFIGPRGGIVTPRRRR